MILLDLLIVIIAINLVGSFIILSADIIEKLIDKINDLGSGKEWINNQMIYIDFVWYNKKK